MKFGGGGGGGNAKNDHDDKNTVSSVWPSTPPLFMNYSIGSAADRQQQYEPDDDTNSGATTSYQSFTEIASPALRNLLFSSSAAASRSSIRGEDPSSSSNNDDDDPLAPPSSVFGWGRTRSTPRTNNNSSTTAATSIGSNGGGNNRQTTTTPAAEHVDVEDDLDFRGFSTSISDLFADTEYERTDCCAVTCCGILQTDRDRYLVTGVAPPSIIKRLFLHLVIPVGLFLAAGLCAMRIRNIQLNQMASTGLVAMLFYYFTLQCAKGRAKRTEVRKDLLFVKHQMLQQNLLSNIWSNRSGGSSLSNHNNNNNNSSNNRRQRSAILWNSPERPDVDEDDNDPDDHEERVYFLGQTRRDIRCAHPCCLIGFYAEDRPRGRRTRRDASLCSNLYEIICPDFCGFHCQLCGICAIAQEAREVERTILPPGYRRVDYVTMEPFLQYYPAIYERRHNQTSSSSASSAPDATTASSPLQKLRSSLLGHPLSRLSNGLVRAFLVAMGILLSWSVIGPYYWQQVLGKRASMHNVFSLCHFMILLLTVLQSAGFMAAARYLVDRYKPCQLSLDATIKFFASGFFLSASLAIFWELIVSQTIDVFVSLVLAVSGITSVDSPEMDMPNNDKMGMIPTTTTSNVALSNYHGASIGKSEYATVFGLDHPFLFTVYLLIATFVVTALVEEMCKYYGFVMVEHPDFLSRHKLKEAARILRKHEKNNAGGDGGGDVEEASAAARSQSPSSFSLRNGSDFRLHGQSIQAHGGAITMAMVAVAVGFTCCENLLYVFLYSGRTFGQELGVLIERTFFPVHLVLAAIQSIGMCRRLLEGDATMKLGYIIRPAVLIHGTFDFLILFIAFMGKVLGEQFEEGDLVVSNTAEFISLFASMAVMVGAAVYLVFESKHQRDRLADADRQTCVDRSRLI